MKTIIIAIFAVLMLSACDTQNATEATLVGEGMVKVNGFTISTYVIDSCEYIGWVTLVSDGSFLTHKGNCKFCEARRLKENQSVENSIRKMVKTNDSLVTVLKQKYMW